MVTLHSFNSADQLPSSCHSPHLLPARLCAGSRKGAVDGIGIAFHKTFFLVKAYSSWPSVHLLTTDATITPFSKTVFGSCVATCFALLKQLKFDGQRGQASLVLTGASVPQVQECLEGLHMGESGKRLW